MEAWDETRHASTFPAKNIRGPQQRMLGKTCKEKKTAINHRNLMRKTSVEENSICMYI